MIFGHSEQDDLRCAETFLAPKDRLTLLGTPPARTTSHEPACAADLPAAFEVFSRHSSGSFIIPWNGMFNSGELTHVAD